MTALWYASRGSLQEGLRVYQHVTTCDTLIIIHDDKMEASGKRAAGNPWEHLIVIRRQESHKFTTDVCVATTEHVILIVEYNDPSREFLGTDTARYDTEPLLILGIASVISKCFIDSDGRSRPALVELKGEDLLVTEVLEHRVVIIVPGLVQPKPLLVIHIERRYSEIRDTKNDTRHVDFNFHNLIRSASHEILDKLAIVIRSCTSDLVT